MEGIMLQLVLFLGFIDLSNQTVCRLNCKRFGLRVWRGCRGSLPHCTMYKHPGASEVQNLDFVTLNAPVDLRNFLKVGHITIKYPEDRPLCDLIISNHLVTVNNAICQPFEESINQPSHRPHGAESLEHLTTEKAVKWSGSKQPFGELTNQPSQGPSCAESLEHLISEAAVKKSSFKQPFEELTNPSSHRPSSAESLKHPTAATNAEDNHEDEEESTELMADEEVTLSLSITLPSVTIITTIIIIMRCCCRRRRQAHPHHPQRELELLEITSSTLTSSPLSVSSPALLQSPSSDASGTDRPTYSPIARRTRGETLRKQLF